MFTRVLVLAAFAVTVVAGPAQAAPLRATYNFTQAILLYSMSNGSPIGANDWSCKPTAAHPNPVVLVHGTGANMALSWEAISPELKNRGFCVFALNYGKTFPGATGGLAPVAHAANQLAAFVDRVLAATGAAKVDIVGHSQGGMMPRQYIRFDGGAPKVGTLIGLAPSNYGTGTPAKAPPASQPAWETNFARAFGNTICGACVDQTAGSPFLQKLNAGSDTVPGVHYVVIETRYDEIVKPWTNALLTGAGATNIVLQDGCPQDHVDHAAIAYDRRAVGYVLSTLDPTYAGPVPCTAAKAWIGG